MKNLLLLFTIGSLFIVAYTTNAITRRRQLSLESESSLQTEAVKQYKSVLSTNNMFTSGNDTANTIFRIIYASGAQVGVLLPNSRKQEYEADH